jgi:hypothetical protein
MTMPTATQIEAPVALPTYKVELYLSGVWTDVSADIVDVDGDYTLTGSSDDGVGFGLAPAPTQRVTFAREALTRAWDNTPVRISLGFAGTNPVHFVGLIDAVEQHELGGEWRASGYQELIRAAPEIRSPLLYRRPIFTATSASSLENPDSAGWAGGLGNLILWRAGGRPYEQSATYPTALFYYSTQTAIMAPEWTWVNGGDAAGVLDELCRAAGGVIYQDREGVIRYQEPMTYASGTPAIHYTDDVSAASSATRVASSLAQYGTIRRSAQTRRQVVDQVRCAFTARRLQGVQRVYQDATPRLIEPGAGVTLALDLSLPVYRVSRVEATAYTLRSTRAVMSSELTVTVASFTAQQIIVLFVNTLTEAIGISEIAAYAMPLVAMEEGTASYGTPGTRPRSATVPDSAYIQTKSHADRLCRMYYDWYSSARPVVELGGCGYDPRRVLGEIVSLTNDPLDLTAVSHRVIGYTVSRTGVAMDLRLVSVAGLPTEADFFVLGTTYADGAVRQLVY